MNVVIENVNSYFADMYGKYGSIDEEVRRMVKSFYDPKVENRGIEKGIKQGIEQGIDQKAEEVRIKDIKKVKTLLTKKFKSVDDNLGKRIDGATLDVLDKIIENILDIESIDEVEVFLDNNK